MQTRKIKTVSADIKVMQDDKTLPWSLFIGSTFSNYSDGFCIAFGPDRVTE
jgi:hypothetical protein